MSDKSIPHVGLLKRNEFGLFPGFNYQYDTEGGLIDWRKMINSKHLTVNRQNFERNQQPVPETIDGLEDKDLLILLAGIKELALLRGYTSIHYTITSPSENMVIATCSICWIPNFETESMSVMFSAVGDATISNTNGFGKLFLGPIAENRAFIRCVKSFLRINILGQDELGPKAENTPNESESQSGNNLLENLMKEHGITFAIIKKTLIKDGFSGAENFETVSDIPRAKQLDLIGRIKTKVGAVKK